MYVNNIRKLIQISWITLVISALLIGVMFIKEKREHKTDLDATRLLNESLLSEKLTLDKEIVQFKDAMAALEGKNAQTDKLLAEALQKLANKEKSYSYLARANGQTKSLKKQLTELRAMKEELLNKINDLNIENSLLTAENQKLESSLTALQEEKED